MTASARDASPSPSADQSGGDQDSGDMAEHAGGSRSKDQSTVDGDENTQSGQKSSSNNAKDPLRPRRKKARRACFACQRAHLTCGDERPCQRCIKRGLQDACHDGVRKKAKYLHDAPDGALMPGVGGNFYNATNTVHNNLPLSRNGANAVKTRSNSNFYNAQQSGSYNIYQQNKPQDQIGSLLQENALNQGTFSTQSPVSPTFNLGTSTTIQNANLSPSVPQQSPSTAASGPPQTQNPFAGALFDPSDPALFNFDLSSMNFGNRYGALEFGMLGHMATGAGETPPSDTATQRGSIGRSGSQQFTNAPLPGSSGFGESSGNQPPFMFGDTILNDWSNGQGQAGVGGLYGQNNLVPGHMKGDAPHAFAIESGPASFTSPGSMSSPQVPHHLEDPTTSPFNHPNKLSVSNGQRSLISTPALKHQNLQVGAKRRFRNPSSIYESVKEPYSYTLGFHNLIAFIQRRFSPPKTLQIAKALASIRPSFIATTKTLNEDDLIFMEKCFQRTLFEYEDFINACGTPTIVCRRTGEVAAVGKEFSILTGWKKDVLLGKEPNLNVNTGGSPGSQNASSRGFAPRVPPQDNSGNGRLQPVFLAELLDDDSVIEFYEDFAKLAFGDSRGSVMTTCKLLKYKTKEDMEPSSSDDNQKWNGHLSKGGIAGEAGMNQLGLKDGKVECSYCWTVKRDVFDIPMLIVMNFLPCI
ncbi:hypothetical protein DTO164E3_4477 [Paecilomyces variotii]|nr:hypothetical protein DTO164E3_4477 [Paecilomyces variotii]KAJ9203310.1 hypothetical protein DTO032I3_3177 [Paecilomyces variotii]KAJ9278953.1 hypothetical protein DTO021D3_4269 [Paecilomyces variotii]KAJ9343226.1 hypothetical protein DTO027B6_4150 [Paecilomyces variotii]KAJ9384741.1 hypothetical protein DTO032I4_4563 [Paecilomyces variotii]